jgi:O-antigen/teichoic acid export membrane protein
VEAQIVRARETSRQLYDTIFTIGLIRAISLSVLMAALALPAAAFFGDPRLGPVMLVLSAYPLLAGISNVGVIEFQRRLDFARVFQLMLLPRLVQIPATLLGALVLQSYWALMIGVLAARVFGTVLTYVMHSYRPRLSLAMWRELLSLSLWTWVMSVAMAVRDRTPTFAIGRVLGTHELGVYTVSAELASLPTSEIAGPVSQAAMPGMAASLRSGDQPAAADAYLRILGLTLLVTLPAALGISLLAGPLVVLALGKPWLEAVPLIAILGATWAGYSISLIGIALLDAKAMMRRLAIFVLCGVLLRGGAVLVLAPGHGLAGLALGIGVAMLLEAVLVTFWCLRLLHLPGLRAFDVAWRPVMATAAMVLLLWGSGLGWAAPPPDALAAARDAAIAVPLGVLAYVGALGLLWWVAGRPEGAEADMLTLVRRAALGALRRLSLPRGRLAQ